MLKKIVSGGQTGADQAGLDAAIRHNISHGGWIPKGRLTESGPLPAKYEMQEMSDSNYSSRTEQNVIDSEATLIIAHGELTNGSALTHDLARQHNRPCLVLDIDVLSIRQAAKQTRAWIDQNQIAILNIAGPRASKDPAIYKAVSKLLDVVLSS